MIQLELGASKSRKNFFHMGQGAVGMNLLYFIGILTVTYRVLLQFTMMTSTGRKPRF